MWAYLSIPREQRVELFQPLKACRDDSNATDPKLAFSGGLLPEDIRGD